MKKLSKLVLLSVLAAGVGQSLMAVTAIEIRGLMADIQRYTAVLSDSIARRSDDEVEAIFIDGVDGVSSSRADTLARVLTNLKQVNMSLIRASRSSDDI